MSVDFPSGVVTFDNGDPAAPAELYLQPGGFHFGSGDVRLRTVLGSCVAITLWHPGRRIGGMCHYLLPHRPRGVGESSGLYADEVMEILLEQMHRCGSAPREFEALLLGGGQMFSDVPFNVARNNVEAGRRLLQDHSIPLVGEHTGGAGHRQVIMELWSGRVLVSQHVIAGGSG